MESSLLFIILMAIIQGITEFLPISSSGHLAIIGRLFAFDAEANITLNIILHAGTLLAIVIYYCKELTRMLKISNFDLVRKLIVATIPVGIVAASVKLLGWDISIFSSLFVAGAGFLITATVLLWGQKAKVDTSSDELTYKQSIFIGIVQAIAVLPGVSRAGLTISAGLKSGLKKADAARFSFLLAIPTLGGVVTVKLFLLLQKGKLTLHSLSISHLAIGFIISALVGYFSLRLLLKLLQRGDFKYFAWYLYVLGLGTLIWASVNICI